MNAEPGRRFSIITVTKNNRRGLEKTLISVSRQTLSDFEQIVIDAHSKDGTSAVVKRFESMITTFENENEPGLYQAMNQAVEAAKGAWSIFLNAGDQFYSQDTLRLVENRLAGDINFGRAWCENASNPLYYHGIDNIWRGQPFSHQATFIRTQCLREQPFDTGLKIASDYKFFVDAYCRGWQFQDLELDICRIEEPGISGRKIFRRLWEKYRIASSAFPKKPVGRFTLRQGLLEYWQKSRRDLSWK